jgi:hypothetical protein
MLWGVVEKTTGVHVVPCTENGIALHPCEIDCECSPKLDTDTGRTMVVIHHDGH